MEPCASPAENELKGVHHCAREREDEDSGECLAILDRVMVFLIDLTVCAEVHVPSHDLEGIKVGVRTC